MSEEPRDAETLERDDARVWMAARGYKQADIDRELPDEDIAPLEETKAGLIKLHRVTGFEYTRAGGIL